jgi:hypothetical protein
MNQKPEGFYYSVQQIGSLALVMLAIAIESVRYPATDPTTGQCMCDDCQKRLEES